MSIIQVKCVDQTMALMSTPVITSGGIHEDQVSFDFCPLWDGYTRTAVFWRTANDPHYRVLDEANTCDIPDEVLAVEGAFYFGVFGVNAEGAQRTTGVLKYNIGPGSLNAGTAPLEPTPDIYVQLLAGYAKLEAAVLAATQAATAATQELTRATNTLQQTNQSIDEKVSNEVAAKAVKKTGDTMSGDLEVQKSSPAIKASNTTTGIMGKVQSTPGGSVVLARVVDEKTQRVVELASDGNLLYRNMIDGVWDKEYILHTGNLELLRVTGEYVGTGSDTKTLTFPFVPKFVYVAAKDGGNVLFAMNGMTGAHNSFADGSDTWNSQAAKLSWSEKTLTLSQVGDTPGDASSLGVGPMNRAGTTYQYIAIG